MTDINPTPRDAVADLATCNAATPGPWFADGGGMCVGVSQGACPQDRGVSIVDDVTTPNAKLIAISREALPYWIERCRAAETRVMYCSFCRAEFPPDTSHDVLIQHSMTCEESPVVQEVERLRAELASLKEGTYCAYCGYTVAIDADGSGIANHIRTCEKHPMRAVEAEVARLRKIIDDATGHSKDGDGTDLLCKALYGRKGTATDWLGGSEARMLHDAAKVITGLREQLATADPCRDGCRQRKAINEFIESADPVPKEEEEEQP